VCGAVARPRAPPGGRAPVDAAAALPRRPNRPSHAWHSGLRALCDLCGCLSFVDGDL